MFEHDIYYTKIFLQCKVWIVLSLCLLWCKNKLDIVLNFIWGNSSCDVNPQKVAFKELQVQSYLGLRHGGLRGNSWIISVVGMACPWSGTSQRGICSLGHLARSLFFSGAWLSAGTSRWRGYKGAIPEFANFSENFSFTLTIKGCGNIK